jgi:hypothetical protein
MGVLIMKLGEYRSSCADGTDLPLKHVTVLEEAHNILKCTSKSQDAESSNIVGKSVEMICNSIAEMRTYGQGFIIVDQSPSSVDIAAIKNTNTKIIMNLPLEDDYLIVGKSVALSEEQIIEIPRLSLGTAIVKQNNWTMSVMVKIDKAEDKYENKNLAMQTNDTENIKRAIFPFIKEVLKQINTYNNGLKNGYVADALRGHFIVDAVKKILRNENVPEHKQNDLLMHYEAAKQLVLKGSWSKMLNNGKRDKTNEDLFILDVIGCRGLAHVFSTDFIKCKDTKADTWDRTEWWNKIYRALDSYVQLDSDSYKREVADAIIRTGDKIDKIKVYGEYRRWNHYKQKNKKQG